MGFINWAQGLLRQTGRRAVPAGAALREFGMQPAASRVMQDNARLWWDMYTNHPPWESCDVRPLGLPGAIGRELSRHALTEFSLTVSGGARAEYLNEQMQAAGAHFSVDLERGLCLGGVALRPYPEEGRILVDAATTGFTPTRFDGAGRAAAGVFKSAPVRQGRDWFVRMEAHSWQPQESGGPLYIIENKAFRSSPEGSVGAPVALSDVREFAQYEPRAEIANLTGPLFAYFKPPQANDVEPDSSMGVSVYAGPTAELIRQADEQWERLRWAFAVAEPKILSDGRLTQRQLSDRVFISGDFTSGGNLFEIFDPEVKDSAYYRGLQYILQRIEYNVGLAFGTISDPQSVEKTATEILAAKHRQFVTEAAIQRAFQAALDGLLYAMDVWCSLARLAPAGTYQVQYSWGDGILDDPETRRQDMALDMQQVAAGLMNDWEFRVKWYGEDEQTAKASLPGMQSMADEGQNEVE